MAIIMLTFYLIIIGVTNFVIGIDRSLIEFSDISPDLTEIGGTTELCRRRVKCDTCITDINCPRLTENQSSTAMPMTVSNCCCCRRVIVSFDIDKEFKVGLCYETSFECEAIADLSSEEILWSSAINLHSGILTVVLASILVFFIGISIRIIDFQ